MVARAPAAPRNRSARARTCGGEATDCKAELAAHAQIGRGTGGRPLLRPSADTPSVKSLGGECGEDESEATLQPDRVAEGRE